MEVQLPVMQIYMFADDKKREIKTVFTEEVKYQLRKIYWIKHGTATKV